MPFLIASVLLQLGLVVHCMKTGRNTYWIYLLLFFPLIGGLAYFFVELWPDLFHSRQGRALRRGATKALNPNREFLEAAKAYRISDTLGNAQRLAECLLEREQFADAKELLLGHKRGLADKDPLLLELLARSHFGLGEFDAAIDCLDELKAANPDSTSSEAHLLYAKALLEAGQQDAALHEFEALAGYYSGPEPKCRLAEILASRGDVERARHLYGVVVEDAEIAGKHYRQINKYWIGKAREYLANDASADAVRQEP